MDFKDLSNSGKFQVSCAVIFMIIGLFIVFAGIYEDIITGSLNVQPNSNLILVILHNLASNTMTSGVSFVAIGLACISIAFLNLE